MISVFCYAKTSWEDDDGRCRHRSTLDRRRRKGHTLINDQQQYLRYHQYCTPLKNYSYLDGQFSICNSRTMRWLQIKAALCCFILLTLLTRHSVLCLEVPWRYQVDLIDGLSLHNSTYYGVRVIPGPNYAIPAISLYGSRRRLQLPNNIYEKTARMLSSSTDFALLATVRQQEQNSGTIVSISSGNTRFLELQSSGRKDEIRLHYTSDSSSSISGRRVFIETFPYKLADNHWHKLAVVVSGSQLELWINCTRIYSRVVPRYVMHELKPEQQLPTSILHTTTADNAQQSNFSLWLGQRNEHSHFTFQGALQDVRIVAHAHGQLLQCPQLDAECPTCGQFQQMKENMHKMEDFIKELASKLAEAEQRISQLEECECSISCKFNGTVIRDGATWQESCELCSCVRGEVACRPMNCPAVTCKNPVTLPGECCPKCLSTCYIQHQRYEHGEHFSIPSSPCTVCTCQNGRMKCEPRDRNKVCPQLPCPAHVQVQPAGECCKTCPDCSYGHDCHVNATCISLNTRYRCLCKNGFTGNGKQCSDIDECETKGGLTGNHCQRNTKCVNKIGSYQCECLPGYVRRDSWNCIDENECSAKTHTCPENTVCVNEAGSYHCECAPGYTGDGINCKPVCDPACSAGGQCVAPNKCSCRHGYVGLNCDIDVDECADGIHHCDNNSVCVNMPGWYYCECQQGFRRNVEPNSLIAQCQDIDECAEDTHTCRGPATCINTVGGYRCECPNQRHRSSCTLGCFYEGLDRRNGEEWEDKSDSCKQCKCTNGVVKCSHISCDCRQTRNASAALRTAACCPKCDQSSQCKHQETPQSFGSGQRWIYQCQVCECLHGDIDCWEMKCPPVKCENPIYVEGYCCPVCASQRQQNNELCQSANSTQSHNCMYNNVLYRHGQQFSLQGDTCTDCKCKIPYCDHLVSNMAINIHRTDNSIALTILTAMAVTVAKIHQDVQCNVQGVMLLVHSLICWGLLLSFSMSFVTFIITTIMLLVINTTSIITTCAVLVKWTSSLS